MPLLNINETVGAKAFMGYGMEMSDGTATVYPLKMSEIIKMGLSTYNKKVGLLLLTEQQIAPIIKEKTGIDIPLEEIDPLQYLLTSAEHDDNFLLDLQDCFSTFLKEEVVLLPTISSVLVGDPTQKRLITKSNFVEFQNILRIQNRQAVKEPPPENETYGERKMRLLHEKVAEAKRRQAQKNNENSMSLVDMLEIATVFNIDVENCTFYAFYGLIQRHQAREKWLLDMQMLCAGADSKNIKQKYWGESLGKD